MMVKSIMIVGVGGQGTLLASRIIGNALIKKGVDVKVSEVHGMSQRGGSVVTYVRFGETSADKVYSPVINRGEADIIIAFEQLEAARYVSFLKKGGKMIVSTQTIDPMPVITGNAAYPADIIAKIKSAGIDITAVDALELAVKAGSAKASNVVLIGVLASFAVMSDEAWIEEIEECVPPKFVELNKKAFYLGKESI
ncbi:MAG: indolepyruvate oxidoreductase subunit beta [Ruminococcus sp.]|nr:indolepyruvate oxidoreductase subunit beta [Ruminococcus sp.]